MQNAAPYLLDVTRLIWRRWSDRQATGVDRVALAYLRHFGPESQAVIQHRRFRRILDMRASQELFALLLQPPQAFRRSFVLGGARNIGGLNRKGLGRPYLNVGHTGLDSAGFPTWVVAADVQPIYFVHDLIPITHPQYCRAGEDQRHRERMLTVLRTGAGVIANSQVTLDELSRFAAADEVPMPPSLVAWLGTDSVALAGPSEMPDRPTFVSTGTIEGRKNHLLLMKVWSRLVADMGDKAPRLLIIGQRGWEAESVFGLLDGDEKLRCHVIELGRCSDAEMANHLACARALLFPSFVEGYGLPLIEALGAGVPVIASDLPVFRELAGTLPHYLKPNDEPGWAQAIVEYAKPDSLARAEQLERIKGFRPPDWRSHFDRVESWLAGLPSSQVARAST